MRLKMSSGVPCAGHATVSYISSCQSIQNLVGSIGRDGESVEPLLGSRSSHITFLTEAQHAPGRRSERRFKRPFELPILRG